MAADLYKSQGIHSREYRQSERRHELLEVQKKRRNELLDEHRSIEPLKKLLYKPHQTRSRQYINNLKNKIMLSEWLKDIPDDIDKWYIKPCPKGTRVLVVAVDGTTQVFNKYGSFIRKIRSQLPGGRQTKRESLTILDCIYVANQNEYFVLDALAYGNQALTDCDAEFRFFWIESHINEMNSEQSNQQHTFRVIDKYKCGDDAALNELLSNYPIWPNNQPELDGFLFYHGEASYVPGQTPLVGWLFPFMLPELFNVPYLNEHFLADKPDEYHNYLSFIEEFDRKLREKRKKHRNQRVKHMDVEPSNETDAAVVVREAMELEKHEMDDDDLLKDFEVVDESFEIEPKNN